MTAGLVCVSLRRPADGELQRLAAAPAIVWKWKEAELGDGANVPTRGAPRALAQRLLEGCASSAEAMVVTTCARLDVLAYGMGDGDVTRRLVAERIATEIDGFRPVLPWRKVPRVSASAVEASMGAALGDDAVLHAVRVAVFAGRPVDEFDPFSSHDAHVLAQLKAAFDDASGGDDAPAKKRLSVVLRRVLEAGKKARDSRLVRELALVRGRGVVGESASKNRYRAAEAVEGQVVAPTVAVVNADLLALDSGPRIADLRRRAQAVALDVTLAEETRAAQATVNRVLHAPTLALRAGRDVDVDAVLAEVAAALGDGRRARDGR